MHTGAISLYKVFLFDGASYKKDVKETLKYLNEIAF